MLKTLFAGVAIALLSSQMAFAHARLTSSVPADGATVKAPEHLMLTFNEKVRVTNVKLTGAGKDVPLTFDRAAAATETVHVPVAGLTAGRYELSYTVIGSDGHPMNGTLAFTVGS